MHPAAKVVDWSPVALPKELWPLTEDDDPRHVANLVRYALLFEHGGLWVDNDLIALRDLTESAAPWTATLGNRREGCRAVVPASASSDDGGRAATREVGHPEAESPNRSGARVLDAAATNHPDVLAEPRVIPFDRDGKATAGAADPMAVHLWDTSPR